MTPRPQPGNPKPRIFRLPEAEAIINRMGFNNHGVDALLARVEAARFKGVLGINIGKNFDTVERADEDYLLCLDKVYHHASYVTVNVSSPNTRACAACSSATRSSSCSTRCGCVVKIWRSRMASVYRWPSRSRRT